MKPATLLLAAVATSEAAIVRMYYNWDCQGDYQERNVWDNTCAPTDEFWSVQTVFPGGGGQNLRAYCDHDCFTVVNGCFSAAELWTCHNVASECGSSHSIGSSLFHCA